MFKRVIIDADVGTDDAVALLIFLYAMKLGLLKIEAIICTSGSTAREDVVRNLLTILEITGYRDIPVYRGALRPFVSPPGDVFNHNAGDAFGNVNYSRPLDTSIVRDTFGAKAMYELVKQSPKEVSIIGLAPLTNIALADRLYDDFMTNVKYIWIMGGSLTGSAELNGTSESNFVLDPEAAYIVLNDTRPDKVIHMLPWETCISSPINWEWRRDALGKSPLPIMKLLNEVEKNAHQDVASLWTCCEAQLAAAYLYGEEIIKAQKKYGVSVELHGAQTRGQITVYSKDATRANVEVIEEIDYNFFKKVLLNTFDVKKAESRGNVCSFDLKLAFSLIVIFVTALCA